MSNRQKEAQKQWKEDGRPFRIDCPESMRARVLAWWDRFREEEALDEVVSRHKGKLSELEKKERLALRYSGVDAAREYGEKVRREKLKWAVAREVLRWQRTYAHVPTASELSEWMGWKEEKHPFGRKGWHYCTELQEAVLSYAPPLTDMGDLDDAINKHMEQEPEAVKKGVRRVFDRADRKYEHGNPISFYKTTEDLVEEWKARM
jgi:hypothetical protein